MHFRDLAWCLLSEERTAGAVLSYHGSSVFRSHWISSAHSDTPQRAIPLPPHTPAMLTLSGLNAFLWKNETVRPCAFAFVPERPRTPHHRARHGAVPPGLTARCRGRSRHFSFRTEGSVGGPAGRGPAAKYGRSGGPRPAPNFPGEAPRRGPSPAAPPGARAPGWSGGPAAPPPRRFPSAPARGRRRRPSFSPRRGHRGAPEPPAPPRPGCGAPPPRRAWSRGCVRGRPGPPRPALPPGGAGTAAARRGTHRSSQGLSPALPSASAPGTPHLHSLDGRSSLSLSFPAPGTALFGALSRPGRVAGLTAGGAARYGRAERCGCRCPFVRGGADSCGRRCPGPCGASPQHPPARRRQRLMPPARSSPPSLLPRSAIGGGRSSGRRPGNSSAAAARGAPTGSESPSRGRARGGAGVERAIRRGACGRRPRRDDEAEVGSTEEGKGVRGVGMEGLGVGPGRKAGGAGPALRGAGWASVWRPPLRPAPLKAAGASRCLGPGVAEGARRCRQRPEGGSGTAGR